MKNVIENTKTEKEAVHACWSYFEIILFRATATKTASALARAFQKKFKRNFHTCVRKSSNLGVGENLFWCSNQRMDKQLYTKKYYGY